jgi:hypothetical protein
MINDCKCIYYYVHFDIMIYQYKYLPFYNKVCHKQFIILIIYYSVIFFKDLKIN